MQPICMMPQFQSCDTRAKPQAISLLFLVSLGSVETGRKQVRKHRYYSISTRARARLRTTAVGQFVMNKMINDVRDVTTELSQPRFSRLKDSGNTARRELAMTDTDQPFSWFLL